MQANRKRTLQPGTEFERFFEKPIGKKTLVSAGMTATLTVQTVAEVVAQHHHQVAKLAQHLNGPKRLQRLWNWVFAHIQYEKDTPGQEEVRTPNRIWAERTRGVDCDDYSVIISSVLTCWGLPHYLRVTAYGNGYQHIYPIVPLNGNGSYVTMDCVTNAYNYEVPYTKKFDTLMPTYALNGFTDTELAGRGKARRQAFLQAQKPGSFIPKVRKTIVGKILQKAGRIAAKINPLAVVLRNALLAALKMNFRGVSAKLQYAYVPAEVAQRHGVSASQHERIKQQLLKLQTRFAQAGGSATALQNAIQKGKGGANLGELGSINTEYPELQELGIAPAAAITVAIPIIELILKSLRDVEPNEPAVEETELVEGLDGKPKLAARRLNNKGPKLSQIPLKKPSISRPTFSLNASINKANAQIRTHTAKAAKLPSKKKINMAKAMAVAKALKVPVLNVLKATIKKQGNTATTPTTEATEQAETPIFSPSPGSSPMPFPEKAKQPANPYTPSPNYENVETEAIGPEIRWIDPSNPNTDPNNLTPPTNANGMGWLMVGAGLLGMGLLLSTNKAKPKEEELAGIQKRKARSNISRQYQLQ